MIKAASHKHGAASSSHLCHQVWRQLVTERTVTQGAMPTVAPAIEVMWFPRAANLTKDPSKADIRAMRCCETRRGELRGSTLLSCAESCSAQLAWDETG